MPTPVTSRAPSRAVYRGTSSPENYASLYRDAASAYANAIYWKVTGDTAYASAAAKTLDAWASTLTFIDGTSDKFLASGIYGYQLANAAEILRNYPAWTGLSAMNTMLQSVFYPMNHDFACQPQRYQDRSLLGELGSGQPLYHVCNPAFCPTTPPWPTKL